MPSLPSAVRHHQRTPAFFVVLGVLGGLSLFYNFLSIQKNFEGMEFKLKCGDALSVSQSGKSIRDSITSSSSMDFSSRKVDFLTEEKDFLDQGEMYSGMWWQNKNTFLSDPFRRINFLEAATFMAFRRHRRKQVKGGVRMTRDWLDFSVEHLSKYVKHITWHSNERHEDLHKTRLIENLSRYIREAKIFPHNNVIKPGAVASTIALLPLRASGKESKDNLIALQLGATLASLWRIGIERAVVVGVSDGEEKVARQSFGLLKEQLRMSPMELAYVEHRNATAGDRELVPRLALAGLQDAMNNSSNVTVQEWLGTDPSRWQHVYFSEPDLVLQTRPSALPSISQALEDGMLMAAHRLEPVPHERDFPIDKKDRMDNSFLLPNFASFSVIHSVGDSDVCCDQGKFYPANFANPMVQEKPLQDGGCLSIWSQCGFARGNKNYSDPAVMLEMHYRLLSYPLFRLEQGTGLPLVGASQRVCVPRPGPANCADA